MLVLAGPATLTLDFMQPGTLPAGATFTRNSTATYIDATGAMQLAALNEPRWDYDPTTHLLNGLLIEEQRTNDIALSNTANPGSPSVATTDVPPLLTGAAVWRARVQTTNIVHGTFPGLPTSLGGTVFASVWMWIPASWLATNGAPKLDMDRAVPGIGGSITVGAADLTKRDQWQRVVSVCATGSTGSSTYNWVIRTNAPYAGGDVFFYTCPQSEIGIFPTSYFPTITITQTRTKDQPVIPQGGWYVSPGGSWVAEFIRFAQGSGFCRLVQLSGFSGAAELFVNASTGAIGQYDGTTTQADTVAVPANTVARAASTWGGGASKLSTNGAAVVASSGLVRGYPGSTNPLLIFQTPTPSESLSGYIRRLTYWSRVLSDAEMRAATTLNGPSVTLNFMAGGLDPRIVFTRASTAAYFDNMGVMRTAAANVPRFDYDPATVALRGLLVEEARTNTIVNSNTANPSYGAASSVVVPALLPAATVWRNTTANSNVNYGAFIGLSSPVGVPVTASVWVWIPSAYSAVDGMPRLDMDTGNLGTGGTRTQGFADTTKRDQWQRISSTVVVGAGGSTAYNWVIRLNSPFGGGNVFYFTCPQSEAGAFASSYIPSGASATTRALDVATFFDATLLSGGPPGKTLLTTGYALRNMPAGANGTFASLNDGTQNNMMQFSNPQASGNLRSVLAVNGAFQSNGSDASAGARPGQFKAVLGAGTTLTSAINGAVIVNSLAVATLSAVDQISIGYAPGLIAPINAYIQSITYWPRLLSNAEMQAVSTLTDPSFDVDFTTGSPLPGAVFARASTGTYFDANGVMQTAAVNAQRFDYDPVARTLKGLLLEDASTNLISNSTGMAFGAVFATLTASAGIAPTGGNTMVRMADTAVNNVHYMFITATTSPSTVYTWSMFAKAAEYRYIQMFLDDNGGPNGSFATFDLAAGVISGPIAARGAGVPGPASIMPVGNGIYRCSISSTISTSTTIRAGLLTSITPSPGFAPQYLGNVANGLLLWGPQLEQLQYPTSYTPTSGSVVTRAANSLLFPISTVTGYDTTTGSMCLDYIVEGMTPGIASPIQFVGANPATDYISADQCNAGTSTGAVPSIDRTRVFGAGSVLALTNFSPAIAAFASAVHRGASSWSNGALMSSAHNGTANATATTSLTSVPSMANLTIGGTIQNAPPISLWARRARYWPRQLTQAELVNVTTPAEGPTLSLDFMTPGSLDPRIAFARASTATFTDAAGVIRTAPTNTPRWDYVGGMLRGVLIEEARTNLAWPSLPGASWAVSNVTLTQNSGIAPDGANTFVRQANTTANSFHGAQRAWSQVAGATYTVSVYAKAAQIRYLQIIMDDVVPSFAMWATFDLQAGTIGGTSGSLTTFMISLGAGLYRCGFTATATGTNPNIRFAFNNCLVSNPSFFGPAYVGVATDGLLLWGVQVEIGPFPTAYIPTTSGVVTRAAESAILTSAQAFGSAAGKSMLTVGYALRNMPTGRNGTWACLLNPDASNSMFFINPPSGGNLHPYVTVAGVNYLNGPDVSSGARPGQFRAVVGSDVTANAAINGTIVGSDAAVAVPLDNMDHLNIGYADGLTGPINAHIQKVIYWDRRIANTEMQQVST